jgi:D-glycero-D-manno-heptose 1,7-bisphosphate phosphatase
MPASRKALFLDRDGTLIIDKVYLSDPAGVELYPGVTEALQRARSLGYLLFLHTNQSGIGRGYYTQADAERVNARLEEMLGLSFDEICIAPEAPDQEQVYRKPSPRFILETLVKYQLAPRDCLMVGDAVSDAGAAFAAGISTVLLRTGKIDPLGLPQIDARRVPIFEDFAAWAAVGLG